MVDRNDMDRLWHEVSILKESQIRHDERLRQNEESMQNIAKATASLRGDMDAKFDALTLEIREGFKIVGKRIDAIEGQKERSEGYKAGQMDALKKFGLWFTILTFAAGVVMWRLTQ